MASKLSNRQTLRLNSSSKTRLFPRQETDGRQYSKYRSPCRAKPRAALAGTHPAGIWQSGNSKLFPRWAHSSMCCRRDSCTAGEAEQICENVIVPL